MTPEQWLVGLGGMAVLLWLSRQALRHPRSHGFYRTFALLAELGLLVLAAPHWLEDRYAPLQLASWVLLFTALALVLSSLWLLRRRGQPGARNDPALLPFEQTGQLVTSGIYRYIRHPMYLSLMLLAWGVFLKQPSLVSATLAVIACLFLYITGRVEERECLTTFGAAYRDYRQRTRMFIPGVLQGNTD